MGKVSDDISNAINKMLTTNRECHLPIKKKGKLLEHRLKIIENDFKIANALKLIDENRPKIK